MKRNILFVTDRSDDTDGGLSYALDLARMMDKGIAVLLLHKEHFMNRFEALMTAATFAEAGEHETARTVLVDAAAPASSAERGRSIEETCAGSGLQADISRGSGDVVSAVGSYLKTNRNVEMVLLSPSITEGGVARDLKRLLSTISRPVVTLARHERTA